MNLTKKEAIKRAKDFLTNHIHIELDSFDFCDFSEYKKPYYVFCDAEACGCYDSKAFFASKKEVEEIIEDQMNHDRHCSWDHVNVFDIEKNQVVKPTIGS